VLLGGTGAAIWLIGCIVGALALARWFHARAVNRRTAQLAHLRSELERALGGRQLLKAADATEESEESVEEAPEESVERA
jgi:hypothetical protein